MDTKDGGKVSLNLSVVPEMKRWFKDRGICSSSFLDFCWRSYANENEASEIEPRLLEYRNTEDALDKQRETIERLSGKQIEDVISESKSRLIVDLDERIQRLYEGMPHHHKEALKSNDSVRTGYLRSWLETRAKDFGVFLPPRDIIERLTRISNSEGDSISSRRETEPNAAGSIPPRGGHSEATSADPNVIRVHPEVQLGLDESWSKVVRKSTVLEE
jgi:hypothetical protein